MRERSTKFGVNTIGGLNSGTGTVADLKIGPVGSIATISFDHSISDFGSTAYAVLFV
tara:strand:- start:1193 stop:1363 length:171 start_codon:yes stop_codon:yes gene_type:complete